MTTKTSHTPTPWKVLSNDLVYGSDGYRVTDCEHAAYSERPMPPTKVDKANAAHIVRCVNEREGLLAALRDLMKSCKNWAPTIDCSRAQAVITKAETIE